MAKIRQTSIRVTNTDVQKYYEVVIQYNSELKFFIEVPKEFYAVLETFSNEELAGLFIEKVYKRRFDQSNYKFVVSQSSESMCLDRTKDSIRELMNRTVTKREVIIVFFNPKHVTEYGGLAHDKDFPQIGMQYALTYCTESASGDKKVYSIFTMQDCFGEQKEIRTDVRIWNRNCIVIDDTPSNRFVLEDIYNNLNKLILNLKEFTRDSESVVKFIESNVKLLTVGQ